MLQVIYKFIVFIYKINRILASKCMQIESMRDFNFEINI